MFALRQVQWYLVAIVEPEKPRGCVFTGQIFGRDRQRGAFPTGVGSQ
jgi:hypothetical protein